MARVVALFGDDSAAGAAVEKLSALKIDGLTWDLITPGQDEDRLMPGAMPGGGVGASGATAIGRTGGAGAFPLEFHEDMSDYLRERGIPRAEAEYFGRRMKHESVLMLAKVPQSHRDEVARLLEPLAHTRVSED